MDTNCGCGSSLPGVARGNDFKVTARVSLYDEGTGKHSPLDLTSAEGVEMAVIGRFSRTEGAGVLVEGSRVTASFPWSLPCGAYGVEITFRDAAGRGRVFERAVFEVVDSVSDVSSAASEGDRQVAVDISVRTVYIGKGTEASDYPSLSAKPKINGVELVGDKSAAEFGLAEKSDIPDTSGLASKSEIPAKMSQLVNDSGFATRSDIDEAVSGKVDKVAGKGLSTNDYTDEEMAKVASALQSYTETDPTVPEWAKRPTKPKYTAEEVGALPEGTKIPSKTSELSNDSGFLTQHQKIKTVNGQSLVGEGNITIEGGGSSVTVDSELSDTSENPVQNKIVKEAIDAKQDKGDYALKSEIPDVSNLAKKTDIPDVSNLATKTEVSLVDTKADTNAANILKKVDKVDGKGLSTNDYTDADKTKLGKALTEHQSLGNYYTKEEVDGKVAQGGTFDPTAYYNKHDVDSLVGGKVDKVEGKQLSTNDYADADKAKVLAALTEHQDISGKQDVITDLEAIREGAAKGETALQSYTESDPLYTKDKPNIALKSEIPDVSGLAKKSDIPDVSGLVKSSDLAKVATSGDYDDLANRPSIPSEVTEQTVSGWGFTKNTGTYSKPTGGIPKSDLASAVQTSLGKADTALQSVPDTYRTAAAQDAIDSGKVDKVTGKGLSTNDYTDDEKAKVASALQTETDPTVPSWAKQSKKPSYTASEVGALPSTTKIPSMTSDLTNDSGFLTEHQKLKTVNGNSLVGEGDIAIEGGGGVYDVTSIYDKTSRSDSAVEITADEYNGLLEAVNAGKTVKFTFAISDEDYSGDVKSSRCEVVTSGEQTNIDVYFISNRYVEYLTVAKLGTGSYRAAFNHVVFLTENDPDLSGAYYNIWNTNIGLAILETPVGSYQRDVSSSLSSSDFNNLKIAIDEGKIIKGITYASASGSGITIRGTRGNISGYIEYFDVYIANVSDKLTITRKGPMYANGYYALEKVTGKSSTTITLDTLNDRVCYYVDNMSSVTSLTVSLNRFNDDGSVNYDQPKEWMIQFSVGSSLPSVTWPSAMRWANGEVLSLEAGYTYEFHIVATRLGCTIVGQKFNAV